MYKKITTLFLLFLFFISSNVFAFNFEDYEWGAPKREIKRKIVAKGVSLPSDTPGGGLTYHDTILDSFCAVTLKFTPHSYLLYEVAIEWEGTQAGQKMNGLLTEKYGSPRRSPDSHNKFFWYERDSTLTLDYTSMNTIVTYQSEIFQQKYNDESKESDGKDIDKF